MEPGTHLGTCQAGARRPCHRIGDGRVVSASVWSAAKGAGQLRAVSELQSHRNQAPVSSRSWGPAIDPLQPVRLLRSGPTLGPTFSGSTSPKQPFVATGTRPVAAIAERLLQGNAIRHLVEAGSLTPRPPMSGRRVAVKCCSHEAAATPNQPPGRDGILLASAAQDAAPAQDLQGDIAAFAESGLQRCLPCNAYQPVSN